MEHALRPGGAERELEQSLGNGLVRPDEPSLVGRVQSSLVTQVDRDAVHAEQLGDPIGDGAQRVREREVGDRLADHGQESLGPFEVGGHLGRALARPQGMSGSHAEAPEAVEHGLRRRRLGGEEELEDTERRISEPDGDQRGRLGKRLVPRLGDGGLPLERTPCGPGRGFLGLFQAQGSGGDDWDELGLGRYPPELCRLGAGRLCGEVRDLVGDPCLVVTGRQRLAGDSQCVLGRGVRQVGPVPGPERDQRQRELSSNDSRQCELLEAEGVAGAHHLEAGRRGARRSRPAGGTPRWRARGRRRRARPAEAPPGRSLLHAEARPLRTTSPGARPRRPLTWRRQRAGAGLHRDRRRERRRCRPRRPRQPRRQRRSEPRPAPIRPQCGGRRWPARRALDARGRPSSCQVSRSAS